MALDSSQLYSVDDLLETAEEEKTYAIWRHYKDINKPKEFVKGGLTRDEAVEHCNDPSTSGDGWFDGWMAE